MRVSFKGHDACPIKNIYIATRYNPNAHDFHINNELRNIAGQEGFKIKEFPQGHHPMEWSQDVLTINRKNSLIFINNSPWQNLAMEFGQRFGFKTRPADASFECGNVFLGKKPDGEQFVLVGDQTMMSPDDMLKELNKIHGGDLRKMFAMVAQFHGGNKEAIYNVVRQKVPAEVLKQKAVKAFRIESENVYVVPQTNYHLDTFIRPVGYPYVLVNDPEFALKNLEELAGELSQDPLRSEADFQYLLRLHESTKREAKRLREKYGNSADDVVKYLEAQDFKPIRIGAVYGEGKGETNCCDINFINAFVHKRPDGQLAYITNGTTQNNVDRRLEEMFKKQLGEKAPCGVAKVHFVRGAHNFDNSGLNSISHYLINAGAGIHCEGIEEPDFDALG